MGSKNIKNYAKKNIKVIATVSVVLIVTVVAFIYMSFFASMQETMLRDFDKFEEKIVSEEVSYKLTYYYKNEMMIDQSVIYEYDKDTKILNVTDENNNPHHYDMESIEYKDLNVFIADVFKSSRAGIAMNGVTVDREKGFYVTLTSKSVHLEGSWKVVNGTYNDGTIFSTYLKDDGTMLIEEGSLGAVQIEIIN